MPADKRQTEPPLDQVMAGAEDGSSSSAPVPPPIPDEDQGLLGSAAGTAASQEPGSTGTRLTAVHLSAWAVARYTLVVALVLGGLSLLWKIQEVLLHTTVYAGFPVGLEAFRVAKELFDSLEEEAARKKERAPE